MTELAESVGERRRHRHLASLPSFWNRLVPHALLRFPDGALHVNDAALQVEVGPPQGRNLGLAKPRRAGEKHHDVDARVELFGGMNEPSKIRNLVPFGYVVGVDGKELDARHAVDDAEPLRPTETVGTGKLQAGAERRQDVVG